MASDRNGLKDNFTIFADVGYLVSGSRNSLIKNGATSGTTRIRLGELSTGTRVIRNAVTDQAQYGIFVARHGLFLPTRHVIKKNTALDGLEIDLFDSDITCGTNKWRQNLGISNTLCIS